ncbi:hypothetical protein, partial [Streptomyces sp. NPDC016675]|uniref:hypothetical protein n=1 Tax=Streptomyces sp. NPDC016675 TaxID=3364970 RepID=UPI0036FFB561
RHATTTEHGAQLVPAAEATRLFHGYLPALSVSPDRTYVRSGSALSGHCATLLAVYAAELRW